MRNLNEIIDLGAFSDVRGAECTAVNGHIRADLGVVLISTLPI